MKTYLNTLLDELEIYWLYIKEVWNDFIDPKPPTGMA